MTYRISPNPPVMSSREAFCPSTGQMESYRYDHTCTACGYTHEVTA